MDFQRLLLLSQRTSSLPQLPGTVPKLLSAIDRGNASLAEIARIISADPEVSAKILCAASTGVHGFSAPVNTIRDAVMRLGQVSIRRMGVSLAVQGAFSESSASFDPIRFSRHGLYVGMLARYLFARRLKAGDRVSGWTPDDVFAAGVLHDIPSGILARIAPATYAEVARLAEVKGTGVAKGFAEMFKSDINVLAEHALKTWNLPEPFVIVVRHLHEPWTFLDEYCALCSLNLADWIAWEHGYGKGRWKVEAAPPEEVLTEVGLPQSELEVVLPQIEATVLQLTDGESKSAA